MKCMTMKDLREWVLEHSDLPDDQEIYRGDNTTGSEIIDFISICDGVDKDTGNKCITVVFGGYKCDQ